MRKKQVETTDKQRLDFIVDFVMREGNKIELSRSRSGKSFYILTKTKYQKEYKIYCKPLIGVNEPNERRNIFLKLIDAAIMAMEEGHGNSTSSTG